MHYETTYYAILEASRGNKIRREDWYSYHLRVGDKLESGDTYFHLFHNDGTFLGIYTLSIEDILYVHWYSVD